MNMIKSGKNGKKLKRGENKMDRKKGRKGKENNRMKAWIRVEKFVKPKKGNEIKPNIS